MECHTRVKLTEKVNNYIKENKMLKAGDRIVTGVSGGADSICLLTILNELRTEYQLTIFAVHINHMIRGEEADMDQQYVKDYCAKLNIRLFEYNIPVPELAKQQKLTEEEAGRNARYKCFRQVLRETRSNHIAVAHNMNDVAETVLFNMARGSKIPGMKGISPIRDEIIRPLLSTSRKEIEEYLEENNISYCTDSTNLTEEYTRNRIRNKILPELIGINSGAVRHIFDLSREAIEYDEYIKKQTEDWLELHMKGEADSRWVPVAELEKLPGLLESRILKDLVGYAAGGQKDIGKNHINEVRKLYNAGTGGVINLPHGGKAVRSYEKMVFYKKSIAPAESVLNMCYLYDIKEEASYVLPEDACVPDISGELFKGGKIKISVFDRPVYLDLIKKEYTKFLDYDKISKGVSLRAAAPEDYIVINNQGNHKKWSRLCTDRHIVREIRPYIPVIVDGNSIIWAPGIRIGESYKVDSSTKRIICFEYLKQ